MAAQWTVRLTPRVGLDGGLAEQYAAELRARGRRCSDEVALLVPTQAAAEEARRLVLRAGADALLDARIMTFPQAAEAILIANHHTSRQLTAIQRELLVADVLAELRDDPRLAYLRATHALPGTIGAVCALLDEIKRGGISSDDFPGLIARQSPGHAANEAIALVYARYQERLQDRNLYDEPGLFWHALERLEGGECKPFEALRVVLLDGFDEFTTTQLKMLRALARGQVERLEVRLWSDPRRLAMTPRAAATCAQLVRETGATVAGEEAPPPATGTDLACLREHLFATEDAALAGADGSVQVLEAAGGVVGECREIARRLKLLLATAGAPPAERLAVFLRSWDAGYTEALRQSLQWYGVPADFAHGPTLASIPAVQAALELLDVLVGDWLRQDVIKLLNSSYVRTIPGCEHPPTARRLEQLALEAGIVGGTGAAAWEEGLGRLAERLAGDLAQRRLLDERRGLPADSEELQQAAEDEDGNRLPPVTVLQHAGEQLAGAQRLVRALSALLGPLARAETLAAAAVGFGRLIEQLGLVEAAGRGEAAGAALDLQGLEQLAGLLREVAEGPQVLGLRGSVTPPEFAAALRQACAAARLRGTRRRRRGVQVLQASAASLERYDTVVVAGLRDGAFPARGRPDVFYSDAERARLQEQLPGLRPRLGGHHDDEALLYCALASADRQAWLTYPLTEADGAPVLRSLYVDEVLRHWEAAPRAEVVQTRRQSEVIAGLSEAGHYLEALEAAQVSGAAEPVATLTPPEGLPALSTVQALAAMERHRAGDGPPDCFSGVLGDPEIVSELSRGYGPGHVFSVSQLNTYAACPMQFLWSRVLRLEEPLEPTEDLDRRDLGTLAHRVLAEVFGSRRVGSPDADPLTEEALPEAGAALSRALANISASWSDTVFGAKAVWDRAVARLSEDLQGLLAFEAYQNGRDKGRSTNWSPPRQVWDVEVDFEVAIATRLPQPVWVRGRLDRLDRTLLDDQPYWVIWDYKSGGGVPKRLVLEGADLQLPLYALAVEQRYPQEIAPFYLWGYYRFTRPVSWPSLVVRPDNKAGGDDLTSAMVTAREKLADYVEAIRLGRFPAAPNQAAPPCRYCDFRGICRVR